MYHLATSRRFPQFLLAIRLCTEPHPLASSVSCPTRCCHLAKRAHKPPPVKPHTTCPCDWWCLTRDLGCLATASDPTRVLPLTWTAARQPLLPREGEGSTPNSAVANDPTTRVASGRGVGMRAPNEFSKRNTAPPPTSPPVAALAQWRGARWSQCAQHDELWATLSLGSSLHPRQRASNVGT
jgi:hypothetical protein